MALLYSTCPTTLNGDSFAVSSSKRRAIREPAASVIHENGACVALPIHVVKTAAQTFKEPKNP
jgi:hypothetical protein